ncbi:MAG: hypothetical protein IJ062_00175 [Firmicutes bacterium]|nr:hypothetical protein [Bacillota bacterium]
MMIYLTVILNVVLAVVLIYLCLRYNAKKYGLFYAFVFTMLVVGIIGNLPLALEHLVWNISSSAETAIHFEDTMNNIVTEILPIMFIFELLIFAASFMPFLHLIPAALSLIMIAKQEISLSKTRILLIVSLNVIYLLTVYAATRRIISFFSR